MSYNKQKSNTSAVSGKHDLKSNFGRHGWSTILLCLIVYFIGGALTTDGQNIFPYALESANGWNPNIILTFSSIGGWIGIISSMIFAHIMIKTGPKRILVILLILTGVSFFIYGNTQSYGVALCMVVLIAIFVAGFNGAPNALQNNWFPRKKGLALGWSTMGYPLATMIFVPLTAILRETIGVKGMFTSIALFVVAIGILSVFWCKNTPEEIGVSPDNDVMSRDEIEKSRQAILNHKSEWTMKILLKEKRIWLISIGLGLLWMVTVCIISSLVPRLLELGFENNFSIGMISVIGFFGLFGSYAWGVIDQKLGTKRACIIYSIWYIIALVLLIIMFNVVTVYIGVFMVGISIGGIANLIPSMIGTLFGRMDFLAASRIVTPITRAIMSSAFIYNAVSMSLTNSLTSGYIGLIFICIIGGVLIAFVKPLKSS